MVNHQIEKEDCIDKDFFTPSEAAKYIGISRATFYRYLETNLIKSVQLKRKTIIRKRDIEALFDTLHIIIHYSSILIILVFSILRPIVRTCYYNLIINNTIHIVHYSPS